MMELQGTALKGRRVTLLVFSAFVVVIGSTFLSTSAASQHDGRRLSEEHPKQEDDYGAQYYPKRDQIVRPERALTNDQMATLTKEWGKWSLEDTKKRPSEEDFMKDYENHDIPFKDIPDDAWQKDKEYLEKYFDEGLALVDRAMEAILSEYGLGKKDKPGEDFEERSKATFGLETWNLEKNRPRGKDIPKNGGWTTERSFNGLVRRVLHSLVTRDGFTLILGGHSAAAGHGNLFKQSYTMQFHKVMEPVFGLLGVQLTSRNLAHGGLGTLQSSMGAKDIYGDEMDIIIWDSGMTEGRDTRAVDLFFRQTLIAGNRVPFLLGGNFNNLKDMSDKYDADVGQYGQAMDGLPECTSADQIKEVPFAARCIHCPSKEGWCGKRFRANCWVNRTDVTPPTQQLVKPGSQVSWHPGNLWHQSVGRSIAFFVLRAIKQALLNWKAAEGYVLEDKDWHVHEYYENIREKLRKEEEGPCFDYAKKGELPKRFCTTPINARTEFTPRANPEKTGLQAIFRPNERGFLPHVTEPMLYTGPDVFNEFTAVPEGEIDVLAIVSNGRTYPDPPPNVRHNRQRRRRLTETKPGLGYAMHSEPNGYCDGAWNTECNRPRYSSCLLSGHNDNRGGVIYNSYSGWLVMTLPQIKEGIIVTKHESWHFPGENKATDGWHSINNRNDDAEDSSRALKPQPPEFCDNFKFEFVIDGVRTEWNKDQFIENNKVVQRVVEVQTLLDDPNFTNEPKDVELALRMTGCGDSTKKEFSLTHVYFA